MRDVLASVGAPGSVGVPAPALAWARAAPGAASAAACGAAAAACCRAAEGTALRCPAHAAPALAAHAAAALALPSGTPRLLRYAPALSALHCSHCDSAPPVVHPAPALCSRSHLTHSVGSARPGRAPRPSPTCAAGPAPARAAASRGV